MTILNFSLMNELVSFKAENSKFPIFNVITSVRTVRTAFRSHSTQNSSWCSLSSAHWSTRTSFKEQRCSKATDYPGTRAGPRDRYMISSLIFRKSIVYDSWAHIIPRSEFRV